MIKSLKKWHERPTVSQWEYLGASLALGLLAFLWVTAVASVYKVLESETAINALIGAALVVLLALSYAHGRLVYQRLADAGWTPWVIIPMAVLTAASTWGAVLCFVGLCLLPTDE